MRKLSTKRLLHPACGKALLCAVTLLSCDQAQPLPDPGAVTLRRLSRTEYDRTVRDVLGVEASVSERFPTDDTGHGFDNLGDVLSLSPLHIQMYQRAAETLAAEVTRPDGPPLNRRIAVTELPHSDLVVQRGSELVFTTNTSILAPVTFPKDGTYLVRVEAYGEQAGSEPVQMGVAIDTRFEERVSVPATTPQTYEVRIADFAGFHVLRVGFLNDYIDPVTKADRNLVVRSLQVLGPVEADRPNPLRARHYTCTPREDDAESQRDCARQIISQLGRRLYRRPLTEDERRDLLTLFEQGQGESELFPFDTGLRLALEAMLLSPHFLFRVELDPDAMSDRAHPLSAHELATRLSYLLWSSAPDDELLDRADDGSLLSDETFDRQLARMLADPRASALVENFAAQWLLLRQIDKAEPDPTKFPEFSPSLRASLSQETRRFVADFFPHAGSPGLPLPELLTARFTYANPEIAQHYGLPALSGPELRRVSLEGTTRRGLLSQGSLLLAESYPTRTSPARRGKWVLEQILCSPPPPPPPNVIGDFGKPGMGGTLRQRLELHRQKPECASCHALLDPIGLSLEGFDAIGRARTLDEGLPVDTTGKLIDGRTFADAAELAVLLADDPRVAHCAAERLFTYAVGRAPQAGAAGTADQARIDALVLAYNESDKTLHSLIAALVRGDAFRNRRGSPAATTDAAAAAITATIQSSARFLGGSR